MLLFPSHAATESDGKCRLDVQAWRLIIRLKQWDFLASLIAYFIIGAQTVWILQRSQAWQVLWSIPLSFCHEVLIDVPPKSTYGLEENPVFPIIIIIASIANVCLSCKYHISNTTKQHCNLNVKHCEFKSMGDFTVWLKFLESTVISPWMALCEALQCEVWNLRPCLGQATRLAEAFPWCSATGFPIRILLPWSWSCSR